VDSRKGLAYISQIPALYKDWREARVKAHVPAERGTEGARRTITDAFGDLVESEVLAAE